MANKSEFLSRGLHKIRTQLAEAQASKKAGEQHEKTEIIRPPQQAAQHNNAPSKEPGKEHGKIPSPRCEELDRARFSLSEKLSNALAILPDGIGKHETRLQELNAARDSFNEMLAKLQALEEISSSSNDAAIDEAVKTIEAVRVEFARNSEKLSKYEEPCEVPSAPLPAHHGNSILPEILSLSFWQLFTIGLAVFLPLMLTIFFAAIILGMIIHAAMGR